MSRPGSPGPLRWDKPDWSLDRGGSVLANIPVAVRTWSLQPRAPSHNSRSVIEDVGRVRWADTVRNPACWRPHHPPWASPDTNDILDGHTGRMRLVCPAPIGGGRLWRIHAVMLHPSRMSHAAFHAYTDSPRLRFRCQGEYGMLHLMRTHYRN